MSARDLIEDTLTHAAILPTVIVGELLAIADDGKSPLVIYPGQLGTAFMVLTSVSQSYCSLKMAILLYP
jgi:hypothetical protein